MYLNIKSNFNKSKKSGFFGLIRKHFDKKEDIYKPFYGGLSFFEYAFYIVECTRKLVKRYISVQKNHKNHQLDIKDESSAFDKKKYWIQYTEAPRTICMVIQMLYDAWFNYSPKMAKKTVAINDHYDITLDMVRETIKSEMSLMFLPDSQIINAREALKYNDAIACFAYGCVELNKDLDIWQQKEKEYRDNPNRFEDLTLYDQNGKAYIVLKNETIYMPLKNYEEIRKECESDTNMTLEEVYSTLAFNYLDYSELATHNIYMLLGDKKFVRERSQNL